MNRSGEMRSRWLQSSMRPHSRSMTIFPRSDSYCHVVSNRTDAAYIQRQQRMSREGLANVGDKIAMPTAAPRPERKAVGRVQKGGVAIEVHSSLLNVVLHDEPHIEI